MKKFAISFLSFVFVVCGIGIHRAYAAGASTLTLSPTNTAVQTGERFVLSVLLYPNGESVDTARIELDWDQTQLEVLSVEKGNLFQNESPANSTNNTNGSLSYGVYKYGTPITTSGTVASVTFRALKPGAALVSLLGTSKVILDGAEKLNAATLGTSTITVGGTQTVKPSTPTPAPTPAPKPAASSKVAEQTALKYFGAFFGRLPSNGDEWKALNCIAYGGCDPAQRELQKEKNALVVYTTKFGKLPATSIEWNVIHVLAYTTLLTATPAVASTPPQTMEERAAGWFEHFAGRRPTSENDLLAVKYMVEGYTPAQRNFDLETKAIALYSGIMHRQPSSDQDWKIVLGIAYSGAFKL